MLELRGVSYRYPGARRPAIDGIDLRVAGGEVVGVIGPNEAGKSTLCLVASGLAPASIGGELSGEVRLEAASLAGLRPWELAGRTGIVFADPSSQRSGVTSTVVEEVAFGPINLGLPRDETQARTSSAMRLLGIEALAERHPGHLSGGQAQLVAIASILAMRPRVVILDEPVAELDDEGRTLVRDALRAIAANGTGILIAEHDIALLRDLGARIVSLRDGRVAT